MGQQLTHRRQPIGTLRSLQWERGRGGVVGGGCGAYLSPETVTAAVALLAAVGIQPVLVGVGRNHGGLASSLGLRATAEGLAQAALDEIAATGATRLVVLAPGDGSTFTQLYDERLGLSLPEGVSVVGLPALLAEAMEQEALSLRPLGVYTPYTYVEPSHSVRVAGWGDAPRRLLAAVYGEVGAAQGGGWRGSCSGGNSGRTRSVMEHWTLPTLR